MDGGPGPGGEHGVSTWQLRWDRYYERQRSQAFRQKPVALWEGMALGSKG